MRVVSYIRMSTGKQEASPDRQREEIARYVAKHGHQLVGEYADLAKSGGRTDRRHEFRRMIADAERKEFDRIVVYDLSRWGRFDSAEAGRWIMPLRDAGVTLETLDQGVVDWSDTGGRIINLVSQEGKHQFLIDTSRAALSGLVRKATQGSGFHGGPTSYGYVRKTELRGRSRFSALEIDPDKAPIVRRIFDTYTATTGSLKAVATMLNEERIQPPRGGSFWRSNTVVRILQNQAYAGDDVWGKTSQGQYHERTADGIRRRSARGIMPSDPIVHRDAVPAIVSRDTFAKAQQLLLTRRKETRSAASTRPLSGLVVCSRCGCRMHSEGAERFRCPSSASSLPRRARCPSSRVPAVPLTRAIVVAIRDRLLATGRLDRLQRAIATEARRRAAAGRPARRIDLEARRRVLVAEIARGVDRLTQLPASLVPDLQATLEQKAKERDRITAEIETATGRREDVAGAVRRAIAALRDLTETIDRADPAEVNAAFRAAGLVVEVTPKSKATEPKTAVVRLDFLGGLSTSSPHCGEVASLKNKADPQRSGSIEFVVTF